MSQEGAKVSDPLENEPNRNGDENDVTEVSGQNITEIANDITEIANDDPSYPSNMELLEISELLEDDTPPTTPTTASNELNTNAVNQPNVNQPNRNTNPTVYSFETIRENLMFEPNDQPNRGLDNDLPPSYETVMDAEKKKLEQARALLEEERKKIEIEGKRNKAIAT